MEGACSDGRRMTKRVLYTGLASDSFINHFYCEAEPVSIGSG